MYPENNKFFRISKSYQRVIYKGAIYHIIQRAPGKDLLFLEDNDYLYFLHLLKKAKDKFSLEIFCFCLMPNHLHLLIRITDLNLSKAMHSLFLQYAAYFNSKYKRKGHVFYGRYRIFLCEDERYLLTASVYIHLNPYRAKLVDNYSDYRWSSLSAYLNLPKKTFVFYTAILKILNSDLSRAASVYERIIRDAVELPFKNMLEDYRFVEKFSFLLFPKINDMLVNEIHKFNKCELSEELDKIRKNKGKINTPEDLKAKKYLIEQLKSRGYNIKEISQLMDLSRQSIYKILSS